MHLTFSNQSRISIITFCQGPVRGRKVWSGPFPFSFSLPLSLSSFLSFYLTFCLRGRVFSGGDVATLSLSLFPCRPTLATTPLFSTVPSSSSAQDSGQSRLARVHRLESGKFLMGYYGVHSAYQRDSYWYNTRATSPRLLDAQETGSKPMPAHVASLSSPAGISSCSCAHHRTVRAAPNSLGDLAAVRSRRGN